MALAGFSLFGLGWLGSNVELPTVSQCSIKLERESEDLYTKKCEVDWELTCS